MVQLQQIYDLVDEAWEEADTEWESREEERFVKKVCRNCVWDALDKFGGNTTSCCGVPGSCKEKPEVIVGAVVRLKSGGPNMTVDEMGDDDANCVYWDDLKKSFCEKCFAIGALVSVNDESGM